MPTPRLTAARVIAPRPTTHDRVLAAPAQVRSAMRLYRRTPAALRSSDRLIRLGVTVVGLWFAVLFAALVPTVTTAAPAFGVAACLGFVGAGLGATRRHRPAGIALVAMLVVAQVAALVAAISLSP